MMKNISIVNIPRGVNDRQVYISSFCEAWINGGGAGVERSGRLKGGFVMNALKMLALTGLSFGRDKAFLVCSRGGHLLKASLPYNFYGEIVPMLWDCWPDTWDRLERDLRLLGCRLVFVTASDVARIMSARLPDVRFVHVPEGVDMNDYEKGKSLDDRNIDVYELGRKYEYYHDRLVEGGLAGKCNFVYCGGRRKGPAFVFDKWEDFTGKLRDTKIIISFPASVTDVRKSQVETLTMRYWEAMLSGCLIVGRCPAELSDILGFDPVIRADLDRPVEQLMQILGDISSYRPMVEKNYEAARRWASWNVRIEKVFKTLHDSGYSVQ